MELPEFCTFDISENCASWYPMKFPDCVSKVDRLSPTHTKNTHTPHRFEKQNCFEKKIIVIKMYGSYGFELIFTILGP